MNSQQIPELIIVCIGLIINFGMNFGDSCHKDSISTKITCFTVVPRYMLPFPVEFSLEKKSSRSMSRHVSYEHARKFLQRCFGKPERMRLLCSTKAGREGDSGRVGSRCKPKGCARDISTNLSYEVCGLCLLQRLPF